MCDRHAFKCAHLILTHMYPHLHSESIHFYLTAFFDSVSVCVCVCVCERERERVSVCVCVCVFFDLLFFDDQRRALILVHGQYSSAARYLCLLHRVGVVLGCLAFSRLFL